MDILNCDLDNTLIYSYKHDIGAEKQCVEIYEGRELSFMSKRSYLMLKNICEMYTFVPTTTRTMEQYSRINLGVMPRFALVCNGGILLENGMADMKWYHDSLKLIRPSNSDMGAALDILNHDPDVSFDIRYIEQLFIFTKSRNPDKSIKRLKQALNPSLTHVLTNGEKIYVVPDKLDKGTAVLRLKEKLHFKRIIAAGDSEFDVPMIQAADLGIAPSSLHGYLEKAGHVHYIAKEALFSDALLSELQQMNQ